MNTFFFWIFLIFEVNILLLREWMVLFLYCLSTMQGDSGSLPPCGFWSRLRYLLEKKTKVSLDPPMPQRHQAALRQEYPYLDPQDPILAIYQQ